MNTRTELTLEIRSHLIKKGVLILDAHATAIDIFGTLFWIRVHFPKANILVPVAGWLFYRFPNKLVIHILTRLLYISVTPVYRSQELIPGEEQMYTKFYPASITPELKRARNHAYMELASKFIETPNSILVVAPYGDPLKFGMNIKNGVLKLFENAPTAYITWTKKRGLVSKTLIRRFATHTGDSIHTDLALAYETIDS